MIERGSYAAQMRHRVAFQTGTGEFRHSLRCAAANAGSIDEAGPFAMLAFGLRLNQRLTGGEICRDTVLLGSPIKAGF